MRFRFRQVTCNEAWSRIALIVETTGRPDPSTDSIGPEPTAAAPFDDALANGLHGPYCPFTRTLKTIYPWKKVKSAALDDGEVTTWLSEIPETCLWEPIHPFLYAAHWSGAGDAAIRARLGIRTVSVAAGGYVLNGIQKPLRGMATGRHDEDFLRRCRAVGCELLWTDVGAASVVADRFDEFGPFRAQPLPADFDRAMEVVAAAGPTRPAIAIWELAAGWDRAQTASLKAQDPASIFAKRVDGAKVPETLMDCDPDLLLVDCKALAPPDSAARFARPNVLVIDFAGDADAALSAWPDLCALWDQRIGGDGCIGWIVRPLAADGGGDGV